MAKYISDLTTREDVQDQLEKASQTSVLTAEFNAYIDTAIHAMSNFISRETGRVFVPYTDTLTIFQSEDTWGQSWYRKRGDLRFYLTRIPEADLLEITQVTLDGTVVTSTDYRMTPTNLFPPDMIVFNDDNVVLPASNGFSTSIDIAGIWGYHHDPSQMYTEIEDSITVPDTTTTTIAVADGTAYRHWQYIKLGDELMQITLITSNNLTVTRGTNGTTATSHASVAINRFNVIDDIRIACTRLVAWAYNNRADLGTQLSLPDGSVIRNGMPAFVRQTIGNYKRWSISGF